MKISIKSIALACVMSVGMIAQATAGSSQAGHITELWVNDGGRHNVAFLSVGQSYTSPCNPDGKPIYYILDLTDPSMEFAFKLALEAYMSGKKVNLWGDGSCYPGLSDEKLKSIAVLAKS